MKLLLKITWMFIYSAAAFQLAVAAEQDQKTEVLSIAVSKPIYLSGYTQVRYQFCQDKIDGFDIRRARLSLKGKLGKQLGYRLQTEFSGSSPKLMDAELTFDLHSTAKLSVGQFLIPFSQENLASNTKLESINRSQIVEALAARGKDDIGNQNGRDIGFQVSGSF
jgi:phosphate-selective porin OprO/OprP